MYFSQKGEREDGFAALFYAETVFLWHFVEDCSHAELRTPFLSCKVNICVADLFILLIASNRCSLTQATIQHNHNQKDFQYIGSYLSCFIAVYKLRFFYNA